MSAALQQETPAIDPYLAAQVEPSSNIIAVDPQYFNLRFVTAVGRLAYVHVDQPHAITNPGQPPGKPKFTATLLLAPSACVNLFRAICAVADAKWPFIDHVDPSVSPTPIRAKGSEMLFKDPKIGGLHYPLREGEASYRAAPAKFAAWRGLFFINSSMEPVTRQGSPQRPVCLDEQGQETDPKRFYPGCYARLNVTVAPYDQMGNKGVTFYLNVVQFAKNGERMVMGFDTVKAGKESMAAAGALPPAEPMAPQGGFATGFGPNSASPSSVPPGAAVPGFAAPPQQPAAGQPWTAAVPAPTAPIPPQQPQSAYSTGGARPPGV